MDFSHQTNKRKGKEKTTKKATALIQSDRTVVSHPVVSCNASEEKQFSIQSTTQPEVFETEDKRLTVPLEEN